jgi:hypothetical protein
VLAASGLAALGAAPAEAVGTRYPFCLQGDEYPALSHCTFASYEQCQATASGRFLYCIANPLLCRRERAAVRRVSPAARPHAAARARHRQILSAHPRLIAPPAHVRDHSTRERDLTRTWVDLLISG